MLCMFTTLDTFHSRGWLKEEADCQVKRDAEVPCALQVGRMGQRGPPGLTWNILFMPLTLATFHSKGWLKL